MKIGIIVDKFPSLSETFILNKVEGLCNRGHEVVVFRNKILTDVHFEKLTNVLSFPNLTIVDIDIPQNAIELAGRMVKHPSMTLSLLSGSKKKLKRDLLAAIQHKYFSQHPCDLYHFEFSGLAIKYLPLFDSLKGKIIVSCRGTAEKVKPISQPNRKAELQQLFAVVDKIHCVSTDMAETIIGYGADKAKIFVNRPAINTAFFKSKSIDKDAAVIQIISVGRFTFQKGYLPGLLAMKQVTDTFKNVHYTIVGDGIQREELQFYIHDLGLSQYVTLAGALAKQQVFELLQKAHIFFLPSVYEGIANVVLEAMAMELPVVATTSGGMEEVIVHGHDGLLVATYDSNSMANQLLLLANDFGKRKLLGVNARKKVENQFAISRQTDVFEEQYSALVQQHV